MDETILNVSKELNIDPKKVKATINLLAEGNTIPFIARYRKEVTGYLDEDNIRNIEKIYQYNVNLGERKATVKKLIAEKGMLTEEIEDAINSAKKLNEVEDIYLPYKEKKKTKGTEAIKMGLEPLAKLIMTFPNQTKEELAAPYLNDQVKTVEDAILHAGYIIADIISDNIKYRKWIINYYLKEGIVTSKKKKNSVDDKKLYENYYDYQEKITNIKSHRILAVARSDKEKITTYSIDTNEKVILDYLEKEIIGNNDFPLKSEYLLFIKDAYKRLMAPSIEREVKALLFDKASEDGIRQFGINLESLLLTPPIKEKIVMGFDPAFRTGCKLAVLDKTGKVLNIGVIYPHEPKKMILESNKIMLDLINKYQVDVIAIGNGTASRESEQYISNLIKENNLNIKFVIVNESGASVYSASKIAQEEFPDYSVEQRSAVSIGRRLQDALSELVKIDPKSIGVGLYQHDLKEQELEEQLSYIVSKIVNKIGVNINTASESILNYISGLNKKVIKNIIEYRNQKGNIKERKDLLKIKGINDLTYTQSVGFLRVLEGINPMDKTNIHPEDYNIVNQILKEYQIDVNLIGQDKMKESISNLNENKIANDYKISLDKIRTIKENLISGIIDPRDEITKVSLKSDVLTIDDLTLGMNLEGTVRNVLSFGVFVDIGLHNDALIHISKLSKNYVKDPNELLKVGDIIKATVINIEKEKEKVSLSLID